MLMKVSVEKILAMQEVREVLDQCPWVYKRDENLVHKCRGYFYREIEEIYS